MPVFSYFEIDTPRHVRLTTSAGDHTRYVRMMATAAPYIQSGKVIGAPTLGWKSPELNTQVRLIAPIWGRLNAAVPKRG
jgi:hypothetical protein